MDGWIKCSAVNGSPTYKHCPPTTPTCQPSRTLPPGCNRNLTLPVWTEALGSTETNTNQAPLQPMPRPKQHLQYLRPPAFLRLPKLRRCIPPCLKPKEAPREGTESIAMPLARKETLIPPRHPIPTCPKRSTIRQELQEAVKFHPKDRCLALL